MDEPVRSEPHVVVITGMSGAGRSHASNVLEDLGYFVVDNLPADLIVDVVRRSGVGDESRDRFAVVVDTRGGLRREDFIWALPRAADGDDGAVAAADRRARAPATAGVVPVDESVLRGGVQGGGGAGAGVYRAAVGSVRERIRRRHIFDIAPNPRLVLSTIVVSHGRAAVKEVPHMIGLNSGHLWRRW